MASLKRQLTNAPALEAPKVKEPILLYIATNCRGVRENRHGGREAENF